MKVGAGSERGGAATGATGNTDTSATASSVLRTRRRMTQFAVDVAVCRQDIEAVDDYAEVRAIEMHTDAGVYADGIREGGSVVNRALVLVRVAARPTTILPPQDGSSDASASAAPRLWMYDAGALASALCFCCCRVRWMMMTVGAC